MNDNFFPHQISAANDEKVLKLRVKFGNAEGYGMWFMLLEYMARNGGLVDDSTMAELSFSYGIPAEKWKEFTTYCEQIQLLRRGKNGLFSHRMNEHLQFRKERSESGRKGAQSRWGSQKELKAEPIAEPLGELIARKERKETKLNKEKTVPLKNDGTTNGRPTASEQREEIKQWTDDDVKKLEEQFLPFATEVSDEAYAQKTWDQRTQLRQDNRAEFYRKCVLFCTYMRIRTEEKRNKARVLFGEIAGFINDRGAMERAIDSQEVARRREFARNELGTADAVDEVGDIGNSTPEWE